MEHPAANRVPAAPLDPADRAADSSLTQLACVLTGLSVPDLTEHAIRSARMCLLDCLGVAAAGSRHPARRRALDWIPSALGNGENSVWFSGTRASALGAAYLNSTAASVLDLDDGHRAAVGHPGAAVIPTVLALAERTGATLGTVLLAMVCGYEAGVQIARARDRRLVPGVATGRWSAVAAAAGAAKLFGLTAAGTAAALAIAEPLASNLDAADFEGFVGGEIKEGIPWSVVTGIAAAYQARAGATGYMRALDNVSVYRAGGFPDAARIVNPLILTSYFKPYSCCRWTHSAIDAILELRAGGLQAGQIRSIRVSTFTRALTLPNRTDPADVIEAQFSLPFSLAAAVIEGGEALMPMSPALIGRPDISELASRIVLEVDDALDPLFPEEVPARIEVTTAAGTLTRTVLTPKGDPGNPMSAAELEAKARLLLGRVVSAEAVDRICDLVLHAELNSSAALSSLLGALQGGNPDHG